MACRLRNCIRSSIAKGVVLSLAAGTAANGEQPNIVLILADDLGWSHVGFNGEKFYETPNIDRLARAGMIFTNAYAGSPYCSPTRASLLSGMYTPRHQIYLPAGGSGRSKGEISSMKFWTPVDKLLLRESGIRNRAPDPFEVRNSLNENVISIADVLDRGGYRTARIGKWHVGDEHLHGFDLSIGKDTLVSEGESKPRENNTMAEQMVSQGVKFIGDNRHRPFFLYFTPWEVHTPYNAPKSLVAKWKNKVRSYRNGGATVRLVQSMPQKLKYST